MSNNRSNLNITGLDFDAIKNNFKEYLKGQNKFLDYDLEGSTINILLDILAYHTSYNGFYANMVANEMFLDSATKRESISSIAKHIGYVPRSRRSAVAIVDVELLNPSQELQARVENGLLFIPINTKFVVSDSNGRFFSFVSAKSVAFTRENTKYYARNIELKEGVYKTSSFIVNTQDPDQIFLLPDTNIDTTSIIVTVRKSPNISDSETDVWTESNDYNRINSDSKVYFLQETSGKTEVYFGDGIVGKSLENGNVVSIRYRITNGSAANGLGKNDSIITPAFRAMDLPFNTRTNLILDSDTKPSPTYGGTDKEDGNSIAFYAPKTYQAQNRAVTSEDYRVLLATEYQEQVESVYVWGGEDNDPPIYGKVFVSIKPKGADKLTQLEKLAIAKTLLKDKNIVSIIPEVIDPEYIYLEITSNVYYDPNKLAFDGTTFENLIRSTIVSYGDLELEKFDRNFRLSKFGKSIDELDPAILSNSTTINLQKRVQPSLGVSSNYDLKYDNELFHPVDGYTPILSSTPFGYEDLTSSLNTKPLVTSYLDDDGNGNVRIYKLVNQQKVFLTESIGTINYTTGKVSLLNFKPEYIIPFTETDIKVTVIPKSGDILSRRNVILILDDNEITINAIPEDFRPDPYSSSGTSFPYRSNST